MTMNNASDSMNWSKLDFNSQMPDENFFVGVKFIIGLNYMVLLDIKKKMFFFCDLDRFQLIRDYFEIYYQHLFNNLFLFTCLCHRKDLKRSGNVSTSYPIALNCVRTTNSIFAL